MRARGTALACATLLVAGLAAVLTPAEAQVAAAPQVAADGPAHPVRWLALGDSYSSGEGVDPNYGHCAQSPGAYARVARDYLGSEGFPIEEQDFRACSGAQVPNVTESVDLVQQIEQATGRYDLITLTIGGNDGGFGSVIRECLWEFCGDERDLMRHVDAVRPSLVDIYQRLIDELLAPGGHIVVLGYPRLFEASSTWDWHIGWSCELIIWKDADLIRRLADRANAMIASAAAEYPGTVHFLDVADQFEGHNLCAGWGTTNEWINGLSTGLTGSNRPGRYMHSFHPNREGHAAEGRLLADYIKGLDWSAVRESGRITLRYDGLTVTSGQATIRADFGEPPVPQGANIEAAISTALGDPRFAVTPAEFGMCEGRLDRIVAWKSPEESSAILAATFTGQGDRIELAGYRSYANSPFIEMADGVPIGAPLISLAFAYLWSATEVAIVGPPLDNGGAAFELRGPSPRGPAFGALTGKDPAAEVIDRGSGEQCGLGPLLQPRG